MSAASNGRGAGTSAGGSSPSGRALAVGIGNSTVRVALMDGIELVRQELFTHAEAALLSTQARFRQLREGDAADVRRAGICSVVPSLSAPVEAALRGRGVGDVRRCRPTEAPWFLSAYRSMDTLGADRFCAVLAAREMYGAPVILIDCGTATTVNVVDRDGVYLGGSIAPGVEASFRALHRGTAQLPALSAGAAPLIGGDTAESMRSGVLQLGRLGLEGAVREIKQSTGDDTPVIVTGGSLPALLSAGLSIGGMRRDDGILLRGVIFYLHYTD